MNQKKTKTKWINKQKNHYNYKYINYLIKEYLQSSTNQDECSNIFEQLIQISKPIIMSSLKYRMKKNHTQFNEQFNNCVCLLNDFLYQFDQTKGSFFKGLKFRVFMLPKYQIKNYYINKGQKVNVVVGTNSKTQQICQYNTSKKLNSDKEQYQRLTIVMKKIIGSNESQVIKYLDCINQGLGVRQINKIIPLPNKLKLQKYRQIIKDAYFTAKQMIEL